MNILISKFSTSSMHYTYWKSVKSFDNFRRMLQHNCPSDPSTLTFALSRLSQFYKSNSNNHYYNIFKSLESNVISVPIDSWIGRELSSMTLSLSYFKDWIDKKTIFHLLNLIDKYISSLNALDISHIMRFLGNLRSNDMTLNIQLNSLLKKISKHIRRSDILGKNSTTANNIICILSSYAKLDITDSQLLLSCCNQVKSKLDELTKAYEIANALNAISRMASKQSTVDLSVELIICELISKFTSTANSDAESHADFLDSISRLISLNKLQCSDQLVKIFTDSVHNKALLTDRPKILRVILRSLRSINLQHQIFINHCINICKNNYNSWSFGALCDLISTVGQLDMKREFINSGIATEIFTKLSDQMSRYKYIPHPETLVNLAIICHYDQRIQRDAESLIHYLMFTISRQKISDLTSEKLGNSIAILFQQAPETTSKLDISLLKWLSNIAIIDNNIISNNVDLESTLFEIDQQMCFNFS